ncbi:hypothetical protein ACW5UC_24745 [Priestia aryabhattai]|uniref:hypothetical protein n=1 Tax=Priestia megaterium TaxID=1404 RepID=UPI003F97DD54
MYKFKSDSEFFRRFTRVSQQVQELQGYFQKHESTFTEKQWDEYNDKANKVEDELIKLLRDADDRITYKEEEDDSWLTSEALSQQG